MRLIRYSLATICFAVSVSCLLLWVLSETGREFGVEKWVGRRRLSAQSYFGQVTISTGIHATESVQRAHSIYRMRFPPPMKSTEPIIEDVQPRSFGSIGDAVYFPGWYAALIFALAGVGVLRVSRQFSIRSALIATTVVAALIGMAVTL